MLGFQTECNIIKVKDKEKTMETSQRSISLDRERVCMGKVGGHSFCTELQMASYLSLQLSEKMFREELLITVDRHCSQQSSITVTRVTTTVRGGNIFLENIYRATILHCGLLSKCIELNSIMDDIVLITFRH